MGATGLLNGGGGRLTGRAHGPLHADLAEKIVFPSKQIIDYKLLRFLWSHCGQLYYSICLKCLLYSHAKTIMKFPLEKKMSSKFGSQCSYIISDFINGY